jgi:hypothetical protein
MNSYYDLVEPEAAPGDPPVVRGWAIRFHDGTWAFWELETGRRAEYNYDPAVDQLDGWILGLKLVGRFQVPAGAPRYDPLPQVHLLGDPWPGNGWEWQPFIDKERWGI